MPPNYPVMFTWRSAPFFLLAPFLLLYGLFLFILIANGYSGTDALLKKLKAIPFGDWGLFFIGIISWGFVAIRYILPAILLA